MLTLSTEQPILVATQSIDMRKATNGLCILVSEYFEMNAQSDKLFLFYNKRKDIIKLLYWDKNGFGLLYKRLEKVKFKMPRSELEKYWEIDSQQLSWLLSGFEFLRMKDHPSLNFNGYC